MVVTLFDMVETFRWICDKELDFLRLRFLLGDDCELDF